MNLKEVYAEMRVRMNEGISVVYFIKNAIIVSAALTIMLRLSKVYSVLVGIVAMIGFYIIGYISYKLKLPQEMAKITSGKYNPYFKAKLGNYNEKDKNRR